MPGVPSGRGCNACRAQKKKCDQSKPACSRCKRLKIACVGAGQQRYTFKEFKECTNKALSKNDSDGAPAIVFRVPDNARILLAKALIDTVSPATDLRYNLAQTFGAFLDEVPRRLGENEALDTATQAVVACYSSIGTHRQALTTALSKYSRALLALKLVLEDPFKCTAAETMAAIMMLMICQHFLGLGEGDFCGHAQGAAQVLKMRIGRKPKDEFEDLLLKTLRGPVLMEGIWHPQMTLTPQEWEQIIMADVDQGKPSDMVQYLAQVPLFMNEIKSSRSAQRPLDPGVLLKMRAAYQGSKDMLRKLHTRLIELEAKLEAGPTAAFVFSHHMIQRFYCLGLVAALVVGRVLHAARPEDDSMLEELEGFAAEAVAVAESSMQYRPLGSSLVPCALAMAFAGSDDPVIRNEVLKMMKEYANDYPFRTELPDYPSQLETLSRHIRLLDISDAE